MKALHIFTEQPRLKCTAHSQDPDGTKQNAMHSEKRHFAAKFRCIPRQLQKWLVGDGNIERLFLDDGRIHTT
jgi:hypothetical protein